MIPNTLSYLLFDVAAMSSNFIYEAEECRGINISPYGKRAWLQNTNF